MFPRLLVALLICVCAGCSSPPTGRPLPNVLALHALPAGVHVGGIAVGPHGEVWIATINYGNGPSGAMVIRNGHVTSIPRLESLNRVAVDRAGTAWFTVGAGSAGQQPKLLRIDPGNRTREYALPPEGDIEGIAIGPDGAPWFANASAGTLGRISSAGAMTYYGPATADPTEIVAGSDGALWFTEPVGNLIGRLLPNGAIKEFRVPTKSARPTAITLGPDGNIWFCEFAVGQIGKVSPDGRVVEYRIPTLSAFPAGIAAGTGRSLWFTELSTGKIAHMTLDGHITEYAAPRAGYPGPIVQSRDGSEWFAGNAKRDTTLGLTESASYMAHFSGR